MNKQFGSNKSYDNKNALFYSLTEKELIKLPALITTWLLNKEGMVIIAHVNIW